MKFRQEIKLVIEGEVFDKDLSPKDIIQSLKWSWRHWWQNNPNWIYGKPCDSIQGGIINRIFIDEMEIKE